MAIKKPKNAEITGNLDQKYWVQKADPLIAMKSVPFTLGELKILDTYISRINAADDTRRTVIFTKEEYEELMGLSCANPRALQKHIKALLSRVPELYMPDDEYISFVLFEKAYYHKDEYGKPIIELTCTETSKNLFFCIGKYHYFKYALENVINLTRKASYLLYLHILTNRYRGEWELLLDELRDEVLDCKEQASYQEYKIFKNRVLDPAVKEVNKKTDCHFTYEPIKRGRKVAKIKFIYQSQEQEQLDGQLSLLDVEEQLEGLDEESISLKRYGSKLAYFIGDIACKNEFTVEQVQVIKDLVIKIIPQNDVMERCNYVISQMNIMNAYDTPKDPIKNRFNYLRKMLEKELKGE
jgi:hypothetical protein